MKRLLVLSALLLGACSSTRLPPPASAPRAAAPALAADGTAIVSVDGVAIEKVPFKEGVSSATVEQLAKQQSCRGGYGAGLVSEPGPVEMYRMSCDDGRALMARCELRQCRVVQVTSPRAAQ
jgi:hypothetical protein